MQLVAQHQDLELLRPIRAQPKHHHLEQTPGDPIRERAQQPDCPVPVDGLDPTESAPAAHAQARRTSGWRNRTRSAEVTLQPNRVSGTHRVKPPVDQASERPRASASSSVSSLPVRNAESNASSEMSARAAARASRLIRASNGSSESPTAARAASAAAKSRAAF